MPSRNALMRDFWSGSFSSRPISTLTLGIFREPCARAADGHQTTAPPSTLMKSRRLIVSLDAQIGDGTASNAYAERGRLQSSNVRFGSKADIRGAKSHVRFAPKSGHVRCTRACLLRARSGHYWLFDHLIGRRKQFVRDGESERLGGLEIDDQLILCRHLHREIGRLLALEDAVDISCR